MKIWPTTAYELVRLMAVVLAIFALLYILQAKLIYFPQKLGKDFRFSFAGPFTERWFSVGKNKIHSLYFHQESAPGTIFYFHGNAGSMESWGWVAQEMMDKTGWDVWMFDYPGFGKSTGSIHSEAQLQKIFTTIIQSAFGELRQEGHKLVFYGRSIGSGIAAHLAAQFQESGVVLESPFYSLEELAGDKMPFIPTSLLLRFRFKNAQWLKEASSRILILHGSKDDIIPPSHGKRLAQALKPNAKYIEVPEGHHNDLSLYEDYWSALTSFLDSLVSDS